MSDQHTPSEEEARHDFANMQDWRYEERRAEFDRMLTTLKDSLIDEIIDEIREVQSAYYPGAPYHQGLFDGFDQAVQAVHSKKGKQ